MLSTLGTAHAAWLLYERARTVSGAATHITNWIQLLYSDSDNIVRQQLERLNGRIDSLAAPFEFALQWSSNKSSVCRETVFEAKRAIYRVETFIAECREQQQLLYNQQQNQLNTIPSSAAVSVSTVVKWSVLDRDSLLSRIDSYIRDLDFALSSVNLAVSMINAAKDYRPIQSSVISSACLLRASDRLKSVHLIGGTVAITTGALYRYKVKQQQQQQQLPQSIANNNNRSTVDNSLISPGGPIYDSLLSHSNYLSPVAEEQRQINSIIPQAIQSKLTATTAAAAAANAAITTTDNKSTTSINHQYAVDFSIPVDAPMLTATEPESINNSQLKSNQSAVSEPRSDEWECIWPNSTLIIYRNASRSMYELRIENLDCNSTVSWDSTIPTELDSNNQLLTGLVKFDLLPNLDFRSSNSISQGLNEDELSKQRESAILDVVFSWNELLANIKLYKFAFMLLQQNNNTNNTVTQQLPIDPNTVPPLDFAYIARLAMYENCAATIANNSNTANNSTAATTESTGITTLAHLRATDEELWLLFGQNNNNNNNNHSNSNSNNTN